MNGVLDPTEYAEEKKGSENKTCVKDIMPRGLGAIN